MSGVSTVWVIGTVARKVAMFAALETKALSASSVDVHSIGIVLCWWMLNGGLIVILRTRGVSLEETCTRGQVVEG